MGTYKIIKNGVKIKHTPTGKDIINFNVELSQEELKALYDRGHTDHIECIQDKICDCGNVIEDKRRKECEECRTKDWDSE